MPHGHDLGVLEQMTPHIAYELNHVASFSCCATTDDRESALAGTAFLEAYLLHLRNLDEFLSFDHKPRNRDAVRAAQYFDLVHEPFPLLDPDERAAVNRQLAHVSTGRLEGRSWEARDGDQVRAGWAKRAFEVFESFLIALDEAGHGDRRQWFDPHFENAVAEFEASRRSRYVFRRIPETNPRQAVVVAINTSSR